MNSSLIFLLSAAPTSHEPQLIDIDQTVFVQLGIFLLLAIVLWRLLWRPYLRIRGERVTRVEGYRQDAVKMDADAAERLAKAELALAAARRQGSGERAAARVRLEATLQTERAKLNAQTHDVAKTAAQRILGREVSL